MKGVLLTIMCICSAYTVAQPPRMELTPAGFEPVEIAFPATKPEKLVDLTQTWANEFNRREEGFDATNVTANTITITANKDNAFYYRERGQAFDHEIRYEMHLGFNEDYYTLRFVVVQIFSDGERIEYTLPNYFNREGRLKEGYEEIEPSIEATVNNIVLSHYNYLFNFR